MVWRMVGDAPEEGAGHEDLVPEVSAPEVKAPDVVRPVVEDEVVEETKGVISGELAVMVRAWEVGLSGELRELSGEVVKRFGFGDELVTYLHFLVAAGEYEERLRVMGVEVRELFRGEGGAKAREWFLTLTDKRLTDRLSWEVGRAYEGDDFAGYFEVVGEKLGHNTQAGFLYGYCERMAKTDPDAALKVYQDTGYPKRIDNTGMKALMAVLPKDADFAKYANWMGEDSKTLAFRARRSLLENWAGHDPVAAADFVQGADRTRVHALQIRTVLGVWLESDLEGAMGWVEKSSGAVREEAMGFLAMELGEKDPEAGWKWVLRMEDEVLRRSSAMAVLAQWAKVDPGAAKEARRAVFPDA